VRALPAFLGTRIARRVFALFFLCAAVPTVVLGGASYWMITREMRQQAAKELSQAAKVAGTLLLARLHEADHALVDLTKASRRDASPDSSIAAPLTQAFRAVRVETERQGPKSILGTRDSPWPALSAQDSVHLRRDRPLLLVRNAPDRPAIILVRALGVGTVGQVIAYGEVSERYLWGDETAEPLVAANTDFCIHAKGISTPLRCSPEGELRLRDALEPTGATALLGGSELFLGFDFAAPSWSVRLARPLTSFTAPLELRRAVLLTLALGIWLVILASNVLLRHRLDPIAKLQDATSRMAAGDFSTVEISTNDELEDLAGAFNTMATRLRGQFALLSALHEVEREALTLRSDIEVARVGLLQFPQIMTVQHAMVAVRVATAEEPDATIVWRATGSGEAERERLNLPRSVFKELDANSGHGSPDQPSPALVGLVGADMDLTYTVLPLVDRGTCFAAVVLATAPAGTVCETDLARARQVADQLALALANSRLVQRLNEMSWGTLQALARSIDAVSPWTAGHSERVTRVGLVLGQRLGLAPELLDQLHRGGLLHDVGKIGVPSAILDKPGKLSDEEFATIRAHPVIGARILEPIQAYEDVIPIVRHHHERFDGSGYPDRLAGTAIPYLARVLTVADVYDALVSRRPYREGWTHQAAVEYIAKRAGAEFDPAVVAAFLASADHVLWLGQNTPNADLVTASGTTL
jgi:putative nucleotidyltransferase with HDIG domain